MVFTSPRTQDTGLRTADDTDQPSGCILARRRGAEVGDAVGGENKGAQVAQAAIQRTGILDNSKWNLQKMAVPFVTSEGVAGECRGIDGHSTGLKTGAPSAFLVAMETPAVCHSICSMDLP